ncbi:MAG: cytochrome family [Thermoleophilaceae bacterium]|jgi:cytochrome P450|nr:cytochrome family [Thermoleophilaceae bacterium]
MPERPPGTPPGPPLPPFLQTLGFLAAGTGFLRAAHRRYGDVVWFRTLFDPGFAMVFDPALVRQVFQAPPDRLRAGEANAPLSMVLGPRSVLVLDGAEHLRHRRLMLPPFHGKRLAVHERVMAEAADRAIDAWPVGSEFALLPTMYVLTLDVIATAVFGIEEDARREELKRRIRTFLETASRPLRVILLMLSRGRMRDDQGMRRFEERKRGMDELILEEIARRRSEPDLEERDDALSLLLLARDEEGAGLTDAEVRDELVTLLVAGHETTAAGLAWTLDLVHRHPRVLERSREAAATGDAEYLDAVVKESLRIRPVVPGIGRVVRGGPFELGGYTIPEGVEINPSIRTIHRRPDSFPQPEEFRPERFLGEDVPDTYTWIPFGGGTRRCLGASFAQLEMRAVLARVLDRAELAPAGRRPERAVRRGVTMVPRQGARVVQVRPPLPTGAAPAPRVTVAA